MDNPKSAIDALLETETKIDCITVHNVSIARYALLELVESPFANNKIKFTMSNLAPSFYIMTADKSELRGYTSKNIQELIDKAFDWAEDIPVDMTSKLIDAIAEKLGLLKKVAPDATQDANSKKEEAPAPTAG